MKMHVAAHQSSSPFAFERLRTRRPLYNVASGFALALLVAVVACGHDRILDPRVDVAALSEAIVSNPVANVGGAAFSGAAAGEAVAYVSLPPGSVPNGERVTIRARQSGATTATAMLNGGFDPVAIGAAAGDAIDIRVDLSGGGVLEYSAVVPVKRPPMVVRTEPPRKRDVALNAVMLAVFSEPISASSLTESAVQLLFGGAPVAGTLRFADSEQLGVTFTPDRPLMPGAEYTLLITQALQDLDGEALAEELRVDFTTVTESESLDLASIRLVFQRDQWPGPQYLWSTSADGSGVRQLTDGAVWDFAPSVSPDGSRIAFARWVLPSGIDLTSPDLEFISQIFVMSVDGTDVTQLTHEPASAYMPSWSPDGAWLAFAARESVMEPARIEVIGTDGTGRRVLASGDDYTRPVWSPNGSSLAFFRDCCEEIWAVDADGSNLRLVRKFVPGGTPPGLQDALAWTSSNKILVVDGENSVWTMNPDGSNLVRVINMQRGDFEFVGSSRDGKLLTLNKLWGVPADRDTTCICPTGRDIHLLNLIDGKLTRVTNDSVSYGGAFIP